ncbi:hypothetical protein JAAARDRAFT_171909 [Jaapia argillacea MUCL 33604]|uniref:Post-SET domain-containing protein n=1 Tax=Jaapia argillacea MUCL 33604 TaxID=933084 RepID=A0A067Q3F9_9AGAM|nr:hypothetical protein JAAARDRAFT_171909 [Jaapia argillacea MUCL 33604]
MKPTQENYVLSYPGVFTVQFGDGEFSSFLTGDVNFTAGQVLAPIEGITKGPKAYTSVQCGPSSDEDHIELNSDLVYINHSCEPNVCFDLTSLDPSEWHCRALKDIAAGTPLTFFYPSTEWDMAQPFDCLCGTPTCLGKIQGAAHLTRDDLSTRGFINPHILAMIAERDSEQTASKKIELLQQTLTSPKFTEGTCSSCGYGRSARNDLNRCGCRPASPTRA